MIFKFLLSIAFVLLLTQTNGQSRDINIYDSTSVMRFLQHSSAFEIITFLEENKLAIVQEKGYSSMILGRLPKLAKRPFYLCYFRYWPETELEAMQQDYLQEQLDEVKCILSLPINLINKSAYPAHLQAKSTHLLK